MGFPGRFHASNAPTVAKAVMNTTATAPSSPLPAWLASFAGSGYRALNTSAVPVVATVTAQIDHARQNAGAAICHLSSFVPPRPTLRSDRSRIVTAVALFDGDRVGG